MPREYVNEWPPYAPPDQFKKENVISAARLMVNAALTAPFTGGVPSHEAEIAHGREELEAIAREMERLAHGEVVQKLKKPFLYEAVMVRESDAVLFLGNFRARHSPLDAGCGLCGGEPDCSFFYDRVPHCNGMVDATDRRRKTAVQGPLCMMRAHDLGYAVGSALWMAANLLVDARPLYSAGLAGRNLGFCPNSEIVIAIPVAAASKNPYADIPPEYHLTNMNSMLDAVRKVAVITRQLPNFNYMVARAGQPRQTDPKEE